MTVRLQKDYEPLPGYKLVDRLGRGGFGEVWKVIAPGGIFKAMKFVFGNLDSQDDDGRPAEQELKALNRVKAIRHPYILSLERIDTIDGQLIIVMELADRSLWDRFKECRGQKIPGIPREELLLYMTEAAEALDLMNGEEHHIQHLDIKPQNLFLVHNHIKVADFGLAKALDGKRGTITGGVTPVYAAPETFEGYASRYTDQYSLAICFQELLTGTRPFNGSNTKQLLMQHLNGIPDLSTLVASDQAVIGKALSKKPDDRWISCKEMVDELRRIPSDTPNPKSGVNLKNGFSGAVKTPPLTGRAPVTQSEFADTRRTKVGVSDFVRTREISAPATASPGTASPGAEFTTGTGGLSAPKLITPKIAAATAAGRTLIAPATPSVIRSRNTAAAISRQDQGKQTPNRVAPEPITGEGSLFPAIVIGIGSHGRLCISRIRKMLQDEFGSIDAIPHIRTLLIDTDADDIQDANNPDNKNSVPAKESMLLKLNRPHHYLQRENVPNVESWLPQSLLYKLPREPKNTMGIRSYGRLALMDQYRNVVQRLRTEFDEIIDDTKLQHAAQQTGRGLRSNQPRVYIATSTCGGTGSGMAIDLAYIVKRELTRYGYEKPYVAGILFVPPADKTKPKSQAMANTYAFLNELEFYSLQGNHFSARFDNSEDVAIDTEAPFARCSAIQLPDSPHSSRLSGVIGCAIRGLFLDLISPVGRVIDSIRDEALALPRNSEKPVIQSFGLFRFGWPRKELIHTLRVRFGALMLRRWAGKESAHLREPIRIWLNQEWQKRELDLQKVVEKLSLTIEENLRDKPERLFDAFTKLLTNRLQSSNTFSESYVVDTFNELVKIVGGPVPESDKSGQIDDPLKKKTKLLVMEAEQLLSKLTVSFIERPSYRIAGAYEAMQQISDKLTIQIETLENIRGQLTKDTLNNYQSMYTACQELSKEKIFGGRKNNVIAGLCASVREYPTLRLKLAILDAALTFYRSLFAQCPDYTRDISNCRTRLLDFAEQIQKDEPVTAVAEPWQPILPPGCDTLAAAADEFVSALPPDDIVGFEQDLQSTIFRKCNGVVPVTLTSELVLPFLELVASKSMDFLEPRLEKANPTDVYFRYKYGQPNTESELMEAFDSAAPDLTSISGASPAEATVLASPTVNGDQELRKFFSTVLEGVEFIPATLNTDIVIYREYPLLEISSLPQMASHAKEAFESKLTTDTPPHTRDDVHWT